VRGQEVDQRKLGERLWKRLSARKLIREYAMDHNRWRKQIGMTDDHDRCEWVNVSTGTGLPGLSSTILSRKTVVCVCDIHCLVTGVVLINMPFM